jgi:hypothetical protein
MVCTFIQNEHTRIGNVLQQDVSDYENNFWT